MDLKTIQIKILTQVDSSGVVKATEDFTNLNKAVTEAKKAVDIGSLSTLENQAYKLLNLDQYIFDSKRLIGYLKLSMELARKDSSKGYKRLHIEKSYKANALSMQILSGDIQQGKSLASDFITQIGTGLVSAFSDGISLFKPQLSKIMRNVATQLDIHGGGTDSQIFGGVRLREDYKDILRKLQSKNNTLYSDENMNAFLKAYIRGNVSQTSRRDILDKYSGSVMNTQDIHAFGSYREMLPQTFRHMSDKIPRLISDKNFSRYRRKSLLNQPGMTNAIFERASTDRFLADALLKVGAIKKDNGYIRDYGTMTELQLNAAAGIIYRDIRRGAMGMGMYGITDPNDPLLWTKIARKNNKLLSGSLDTARFLDLAIRRAFHKKSSRSWFNPSWYSDNQLKEIETDYIPQRGSTITLRQAKYGLRPSYYLVATYSIDDFDPKTGLVRKGHNWNDGKTYDDFRDYHHSTVLGSMNLDKMFSMYEKLGRKRPLNNLFLDDIIYLDIALELKDPNNNPLGSILYKLLQKKQLLLKKRYIHYVQHGIDINGKRYKFTRGNKTQFLFIRDSLYDDIVAQDENFFRGGVSKNTKFSNWSDFVGVIDHMNKGATGALSLLAAYGSTIDKNKIAVIDLLNLSGSKLGDKSGMNGASIISSKIMPYGSQARFYNGKGTLMPIDILRLVELYNDGTGQFQLNGMGKGLKVTIGKDTQAIINLSDIKDALHRFKKADGTWMSSKEIAASLSPDDLKLYAKKTYEDANKLKLWINPQMAQLLNLNKDDMKMFRTAFMKRYRDLGTILGAKKYLFSGKDELSRMVQLNPWMIKSSAAQLRITTARQLMMRKAGSGALFLPLNVTNQDAMAAPWIIDVMNRAVANSGGKVNPLLKSLLLGNNGAVFKNIIAKELGISRFPAATGSIQSVNNASSDKTTGLSYDQVIDMLTGTTGTSGSSRADAFNKVLLFLGMDKNAIYLNPNSDLLQKLQSEDFDGDVNRLIGLGDSGNAARLKDIFLITAKRDNELLAKYNANSKQLQERQALHTVKVRTARRGQTYSIDNETLQGAKDIVLAVTLKSKYSAGMGAAAAVTRNAMNMKRDPDVLRALADALIHYDVSSTRSKKGTDWKSTKLLMKILGHQGPFSDFYRLVIDAIDLNGNIDFTKIDKEKFAKVNLPSRTASGTMNVGLLLRFLANQYGMLDDGFDWNDIFNHVFGNQNLNTASGRLRLAVNRISKSMLKGLTILPGDEVASQLAALVSDAEKLILLQVDAEVLKDPSAHEKSWRNRLVARRKKLAGVGVANNFIKEGLSNNDAKNLDIVGSLRSMGFTDELILNTIDLSDLMDMASGKVTIPKAKPSKIKALSAISQLDKDQITLRLNKIKFSPSMIGMAMSDPILWANRYIGGNYNNADVSLSTFLGSAMHYAMQSFWEKRKSHNGSSPMTNKLQDAAIQEALQLFDKYLLGKANDDAYRDPAGNLHKLGVLSHLPNKNSKIKSAYDKDKNFIANQLKDLYKLLDYLVLGTLIPLQFELGKKINSPEDVGTTGRADVAFRNRKTGGIVIGDIKNYAGGNTVDNLKKFTRQIQLYASGMADLGDGLGPRSWEDIMLEGNPSSVGNNPLLLLTIINPLTGIPTKISNSPEAILLNKNKYAKAIQIIQALPDTGININTLRGVQQSLFDIFDDKPILSVDPKKVSEARNRISNLTGSAAVALGLSINKDVEDIRAQNEKIRKFAYANSTDDNQIDNPWESYWASVKSQTSAINNALLRGADALTIEKLKALQDQSKLALMEAMRKQSILAPSKLTLQLKSFNDKDILNTDTSKAVNSFNKLRDSVISASQAYMQLIKSNQEAEDLLTKIKGDIANLNSKPTLTNEEKQSLALKQLKLSQLENSIIANRLALPSGKRNVEDLSKLFLRYKRRYIGQNKANLTQNLNLLKNDPFGYKLKTLSLNIEDSINSLVESYITKVKQFASSIKQMSKMKDLNGNNLFDKDFIEKMQLLSKKLNASITNKRLKEKREQVAAHQLQEVVTQLDEIKSTILPNPFEQIDKGAKLTLTTIQKLIYTYRRLYKIQNPKASSDDINAALKPYTDLLNESKEITQRLKDQKTSLQLRDIRQELLLYKGGTLTDYLRKEIAKQDATLRIRQQLQNADRKSPNWANIKQKLLGTGSNITDLAIDKFILTGDSSVFNTKGRNRLPLRVGGLLGYILDNDNDSASNKLFIQQRTWKQEDWNTSIDRTLQSFDNQQKAGHYNSYLQVNLQTQRYRQILLDKQRLINRKYEESQLSDKTYTKDMRDSDLAKLGISNKDSIDNRVSAYESLLMLDARYQTSKNVRQMQYDSLIAGSRIGLITPLQQNTLNKKNQIHSWQLRVYDLGHSIASGKLTRDLRIAAYNSMTAYKNLIAQLNGTDSLIDELFNRQIGHQRLQQQLGFLSQYANYLNSSSYAGTSQVAQIGIRSQQRITQSQMMQDRLNDYYLRNKDSMSELDKKRYKLMIDSLDKQKVENRLNKLTNRQYYDISKQNYLQTRRVEYQSQNFNNNLLYQQTQRAMQMSGLSNTRLGRAYLNTMSQKNMWQNQMNNLSLQRDQVDLQRSKLQAVLEAMKQDPTTKPEAISAQLKIISGLDKQYSSLNEDVKKANSMMSSFSGAAGVANTVFTALSATVVQFAIKTIQKLINQIKTFISTYDKAMTLIQQITTDGSGNGMTDEQKNIVGSNLVSNAAKWKVSTSDVLSAATTLYRQGLSDDLVANRTLQVVKMSKLSGLSVADTTKLITVSLNTGLADSAQLVTDVISAIGDSAATSAALISKGFQKAAASAASVGVLYEDLVAMLAAITSLTQLGGNTAGVMLNTLFGRWKSTTLSDVAFDSNGNIVSRNDVYKALNTAGIDMYDSSGKQRSFSDVMVLLGKTWQTLLEWQQNLITTSLAGTRQTSNFSALMSAFSLTDSNGNTVILNLLDKADNAEGTTLAKWEVYEQSLLASTTNLADSFNELIQPLSLLLPIITDFIDFISGGLQSLSKGGIGGAAMVGGFGLSGGAIGAGLGGTVGGVPGALIGAFIGTALGAIGTVLGASVYNAFNKALLETSIADSLLTQSALNKFQSSSKNRLTSNSLYLLIQQLINSHSNGLLWTDSLILQITKLTSSVKLLGNQSDKTVGQLVDLATNAKTAGDYLKNIVPTELQSDNQISSDAKLLKLSMEDGLYLFGKLYQIYSVGTNTDKTIRDKWNSIYPLMNISDKYSLFKSSNGYTDDEARSAFFANADENGLSATANLIKLLFPKLYDLSTLKSVSSYGGYTYLLLFNDDSLLYDALINGAFSSIISSMNDAISNSNGIIDIGNRQSFGLRYYDAYNLTFSSLMNSIGYSSNLQLLLKAMIIDYMNRGYNNNNTLGALSDVFDFITHPNATRNSTFRSYFNSQDNGTLLLNGQLMTYDDWMNYNSASNTSASQAYSGYTQGMLSSDSLHYLKIQLLNAINNAKDLSQLYDVLLSTGNLYTIALNDTDFYKSIVEPLYTYLDGVYKRKYARQQYDDDGLLIEYIPSSVDNNTLKTIKRLAYSQLSSLGFNSSLLLQSATDWRDAKNSIDAYLVSGVTSYLDNVYLYLKNNGKDIWGSADSFKNVFNTLDGKTAIISALSDAKNTAYQGFAISLQADIKAALGLENIDYNDRSSLVSKLKEIGREDLAYLVLEFGLTDTGFENVDALTAYNYGQSTLLKIALLRKESIPTNYWSNLAYQTYTHPTTGQQASDTAISNITGFTDLLIMLNLTSTDLLYSQLFSLAQLRNIAKYKLTGGASNLSNVLTVVLLMLAKKGYNITGLNAGLEFSLNGMDANTAKELYSDEYITAILKDLGLDYVIEAVRYKTNNQDMLWADIEDARSSYFSGLNNSLAATQLRINNLSLTLRQTYNDWTELLDGQITSFDSVLSTVSEDKLAEALFNANGSLQGSNYGLLQRNASITGSQLTTLQIITSVMSDITPLLAEKFAGDDNYDFENMSTEDFLRFIFGSYDDTTSMMQHLEGTPIGSVMSALFTSIGKGSLYTDLLMGNYDSNTVDSIVTDFLQTFSSLSAKTSYLQLVDSIYQNLIDDTKSTQYSQISSMYTTTSSYADASAAFRGANGGTGTSAQRSVIASFLGIDLSTVKKMMGTKSGNKAIQSMLKAKKEETVNAFADAILDTVSDWDERFSGQTFDSETTANKLVNILDLGILLYIKSVGGYIANGQLVIPGLETSADINGSANSYMLDQSTAATNYLIWRNMTTELRANALGYTNIGELQYVDSGYYYDSYGDLYYNNKINKADLDSYDSYGLLAGFSPLQINQSTNSRLGAFIALANGYYSEGGEGKLNDFHSNQVYLPTMDELTQQSIIDYQLYGTTLSKLNMYDLLGSFFGISGLLTGVADFSGLDQSTAQALIGSDGLKATISDLFGSDVLLIILDIAYGTDDLLDHIHSLNETLGTLLYLASIKGKLGSLLMASGFEAAIKGGSDLQSAITSLNSSYSDYLDGAKALAKYKAGNRTDAVLSEMSKLTGRGDALLSVKKGSSQANLFIELALRSLQTSYDSYMYEAQGIADALTELTYQLLSLSGVNISLLDINTEIQAGTFTLENGQFNDSAFIAWLLEIGVEVNDDIITFAKSLAGMYVSWDATAKQGDTTGYVGFNVDTNKSNTNFGVDAKHTGGTKTKSSKTAVLKYVLQVQAMNSQYEHTHNLYSTVLKMYLDQGQYTMAMAATLDMIDLNNKYGETLKSNIQQLKSMLATLSTGTDDWKKLNDQLNKDEESYAKLIALNKQLTKELLLLRQKVRKTRTDLLDTILDIIKAQIDNQDQILLATASILQSIVDVIKQRYQDEWDLVSEDIDKKKLALLELKSLISLRLQARKDAADLALKYELLALMQAQLAAVEADSSRTKLAALLREKIADLLELISWDIADKQAEALQNDIQNQIDALSEYQSLGSQDLLTFLLNANNFADEVSSVMSKSYELILSWLKANSKLYNDSLLNTQLSMVKSWEDTLDKMFNIALTYWTLINNVLSNLNLNTASLELIASARQAYIEWMKLNYIGDNNRTFYDLSNELQAYQISEWGTLFDDWINANDTSTMSLYETLSTQFMNEYWTNMQKIMSSWSVTVNNSSGTYNPPDTTQLGLELELLEHGYKVTATDDFGNKQLKKFYIKDYDSQRKAWEAAYSLYCKARTDKRNPTLLQFATGGLADYTGLMQIDGSPNKPLRILSAHQTLLFDNMIDTLLSLDSQKDILSGIKDTMDMFNSLSSYRDILDDFSKVNVGKYLTNVDTGLNTTNNVTIGDVNVTIEGAKFDDDADYEYIANRVGQLFTKSLSRNGLNFGNYRF